jgi:hypothetical protein
MFIIYLHKEFRVLSFNVSGVIAIKSIRSYRFDDIFQMLFSELKNYNKKFIIYEDFYLYEIT